MTAKSENGRPAERVYFAFRNERLELVSTNDESDEELNKLRERVRQLNAPIEIEEETDGTDHAA